VVFPFGSVLRMYKGARGPKSDSCSEGTRLARDGRQPARKRRKSAVICFQNGPKKAKSIGQVNPNCERMKLLRAAEAPQQRQARLEQNIQRLHFVTSARTLVKVKY
jgi:hypothetical protein